MLEMLSNTGVSDLKWLKGAPLVWLDISHTPVRDLAALSSTPIEHLRAMGQPAFDLGTLRKLSSLQTMELAEELSAKAEASLRKHKRTVTIGR